jgi:ACS family hexuronate transporter-like MFS transporter
MTEREASPLRWYVAGLLCMASTLNYLDRQALSVLADTLQRELHLTTEDYSRITSAFLFSYTAMYAVSGRIVDWMGNRRGYPLFVGLWSFADILHGLARTAGQLTGFRILLGAVEPGNFPAGLRAVSEWFPMRERALGVGIFNSGTALGSALAAPVVSFVALAWGWQSAFVLTGLLGFVWVAAWLLFYRVTGGPPACESTSIKPAPFRELIAMRATWGCVAARVLTDPISYFLFFWIPKYLQQERHFNLADIGKYGWIPYAALTVGNLFAGGMPRWLISRGWPLNRARKTTMFVISALIPFCYLLVTRAPSPALAVAAIACCMFGHAAWGNVILPAEVFSDRSVGTVTGIGGACGGLVGAFTQLGIGWIVTHQSFAPVFATCALMYLIAFAAVHYLIGELGVIRD